MYGYFKYGLSANNYAWDTSQATFSGNNNSAQPFSFTMFGVTLNASTTYHYRIVGFSMDGVSEADGGDQTFQSP